MGGLRAFDHVGVTVADLDAAMAFFVGLGLEVEGRTFVEGEFISTRKNAPAADFYPRHGFVTVPQPGPATRWRLTIAETPVQCPSYIQTAETTSV